MQLAFIPPLSLLDTVVTRPMQLMLPQHVDIPTVKKHFLKARRLGGHIILDNGANEGKTWSAEDLSVIAADFFVNEVVMPDVMGDFQTTFDQAKEFLGSDKKGFRTGVAFGFVLHGRSYIDCVENYHTLLSAPKLLEQIGVIYLPRMLVTEDALRTRVELADYIMSIKTPNRKLKKPIHFLGASPYWMREVKEAAKLANGSLKRVRSMDTSAPYVYAMRNKYIDEGVIRRDEETYFDSVLDSEQREIAQGNCNVMDLWSGTRHVS